MNSADKIKDILLTHPLVSDASIEDKNGTWEVRCVANKDNQKKIEDRQTQTWGRVWGDAYQRGNNTGNKLIIFSYNNDVEKPQNT